MAVIRQSKRSLHSAKRLDVGALKRALRDNRVETRLGVVTRFDGEASHFEIITEAGVQDVLVDVEIMPTGERAACRLGAAAGGAGGGVYRIPPAGTEVALLVPDGDLEADPLIVATLSTGQLPPDMAEDVVIIAGPMVRVHADKIKLGSKDAEESMVLGDTYRDAEHEMNAGTVGVGPSLQKAGIDPVLAYLCPAAAANIAAAAAAISAFEAQASQFLSSKVKGE